MSTSPTKLSADHHPELKTWTASVFGIMSFSSSLIAAGAKVTDIEKMNFLVTDTAGGAVLFGAAAIIAKTWDTPTMLSVRQTAWSLAEQAGQFVDESLELLVGSAIIGRTIEVQNERTVPDPASNSYELALRDFDVFEVSELARRTIDASTAELYMQN